MFLGKVWTLKHYLHPWWKVSNTLGLKLSCQSHGHLTNLHPFWLKYNWQPLFLQKYLIYCSVSLLNDDRKLVISSCHVWAHYKSIWNFATSSILQVFSPCNISFKKYQFYNTSLALIAQRVKFKLIWERNFKGYWQGSSKL